VKDQFDDYRESTIGGSSSSPPLEAPLILTTYYTAAFLTQTVNLEDGTAVKFEIWYALPIIPHDNAFDLTVVQGHSRSGAL